MIALGSVMCTFHQSSARIREIAAPRLVPITAPDSTPHCTKNIITPTEILPLAQPVNVADTVIPVNRAINTAKRRMQANRIAQQTTTAMTKKAAKTQGDQARERRSSLYFLSIKARIRFLGVLLL